MRKPVEALSRDLGRQGSAVMGQRRRKAKKDEGGVPRCLVARGPESMAVLPGELLQSDPTLDLPLELQLRSFTLEPGAFILSHLPAVLLAAAPI